MPLWTLSHLSLLRSHQQQHRRTHDQDRFDRLCHCQSVDLGCYSFAVFQRCLGLRCLGTFLVSLGWNDFFYPVEILGFRRFEIFDACPLTV
jgi:hypothetical protein